MRRRASKLPQPKTDVVPIINVSLVVVLTLMVISPFLNESEMEVDLPEARTTEANDQDKVEIILTREGELAVQEEAVGWEELQPVLAGYFGENPSSIAVVKADEGIAYGSIEALLSVIQGAGAPRIALATEQPTAGGAE